VKSNFKKVTNSAKTFWIMAVNVNVNGANIGLIKKIFLSFVKLAAKMKNKNNKVSQKI